MVRPPDKASLDTYREKPAEGKLCRDLVLVGRGGLGGVGGIVQPTLQGEEVLISKGKEKKRRFGSVYTYVCMYNSTSNTTTTAITTSTITN